MDTTTIIVNVLTFIGAGGAIATPTLAIALAAQSRWTRAVASRNAEQAVTIAGLDRRLADVSAIRRAPPAHLSVIMDAAKTFRSYEAHHATEAEAAKERSYTAEGEGSTIEAEAALARYAKAATNRAMAERLEGLMIGHTSNGGTEVVR